MYKHTFVCDQCGKTAPCLGVGLAGPEAACSSAVRRPARRRSRCHSAEAFVPIRSASALRAGAVAPPGRRAGRAGAEKGLARWRWRVVVYGRVAPEPGPTMTPRATGPEGPGVKGSPRAWSWAALMHRAFGIDVLACAHCGGRLRLIATLHDPAVIRKILAHLALSPSGPSPGPRSTRVRRRRVLIGSGHGRGGRCRVSATRACFGRSADRLTAMVCLA
jgi:hypothetical protein